MLKLLTKKETFVSDDLSITTKSDSSDNENNKSDSLDGYDDSENNKLDKFNNCICVENTFRCGYCKGSFDKVVRTISCAVHGGVKGLDIITCPMCGH